MAAISVIYGSYREGRQGIKLARFLTRQLHCRGHTVHLIDAKAHDLPMLSRKYDEYDEPPKELRRIHEWLEESDAFIFVAGEYNHSVQPGLKNLIDHFKREYAAKPAGIACYSTGSFGGVRVAVHMRVILGELGMVSLPAIFAVPKVRDAFDDEGNALDPAYDERVQNSLTPWSGTHRRLQERGTRGCRSGAACVISSRTSGQLPSRRPGAQARRCSRRSVQGRQGSAGCAAASRPGSSP